MTDCTQVHVQILSSQGLKWSAIARTTYMTDCAAADPCVYPVGHTMYMIVSTLPVSYNFLATYVHAKKGLHPSPALDLCTYNYVNPASLIPSLKWSARAIATYDCVAVGPCAYPVGRIYI